MSSLTDIDKRYLERLLVTQPGYILDYTDPTYGEFFQRHKIDIHGPKYQTYGTSKAKKLRAFWEQESDELVGTVLNEMLDSYEASCELDGRELDKPILEKSRAIVARLGGKLVNRSNAETESEFLSKEFSIPNIEKLPIEPAVASDRDNLHTELGALHAHKRT